MAKVKKVEDNELQLICDCGAVHVISMEDGKFKLETYSAKPKPTEKGKEHGKENEGKPKRTVSEFFGFGSEEGTTDKD